MDVYHFYQGVNRQAQRETAILPDDEAAFRHAVQTLRVNACVDVWQDARHVAQLWGATDGLPSCAYIAETRVIRALIETAND